MDRPIVRGLVGVVVWLSVPFLLLVAVIGAVDDEVTLFERVLMCGVNPLAIVGAAWSFTEERVAQRWGRLVEIACWVAIAANVAAAALIVVGSGSGDMELPIIFAAPFALWLVWFRLISPLWS